MIPNNSTDPRFRGVTTPDPVDNINAPPKTVTNVMPIQFFAVEFGDDEGRKHTTVVAHMGGMIYMDPSGEDWAKRQRAMPPASWFGQQTQKMIDQGGFAKAEKPSEPLPKEDKVDIMGSNK